MEQSTVTVRVRKEDADIPLPSYQSREAAGMDVHSNNPVPIIIQPGTSALVETGLRFCLPLDVRADVRSRSGLALRSNVLVFHGLIDPDYRGILCVLLFNLSSTRPFTVKRGDKIAQLVFTPLLRVRLEQVEDIGETERGEKGFGSTGRK